MGHRGAGVLFALGTVLVVPVLVLEGLRPVPALRRSATLFRAKLGETTGGELGLRAATLAVLHAVFSTVLHRFATGRDVDGRFGDLAALFAPPPPRYAPAYPVSHGGLDAT